MISMDMGRERIEPEMSGLRLGIVLWLAVGCLFVLTNVVIEMASGAAVMNGELRGTGVLHREDQGTWRIVQYNLTFTVPNDKADKVVELIR